jgi:mRNA interferase MazF
MAFGDIVWANLPPPDGHAQAGTRPAVLVQSDEADALLNTRTVLPVTTSAGAARFPGTVPVRATPANGLPRDSTILVAAITTLDKAKVGGKRGRLDDATIALVKDHLRTFLQLHETKRTLADRLRDWLRWVQHGG